MQDFSEHQLQATLDADPRVRKILAAVHSRNARVFLGGGALRDMLLGHKESGDLDLYIECKPEEFSNLKKTLFADESLRIDAVRGNLDIHRAKNVRFFTQQFDFTINTPVYALDERKLYANKRALDHISARQLSINALSYFATSQRSFIRGFRLAQSRNLSLDADYISAVREYGSMLSFGDAAKRSVLMGEIMHLFSLPSLDKMWGPLSEARLFQHLFPFLLASEKAMLSPPFSVLQSNIRALTALDQNVQSISEEARKWMLAKTSAMQCFESSKFHLQVNYAAIVRLAMLFDGVGAAWVNLDKSTNSSMPAEVACMNSTKVLMEELLRTLAGPAPISEALAMSASLATFAQRATTWSWSTLLANIENSPDPALRRMISLYYMSRVQSEIGGNLDTPSRAERVQALRALCEKP